MSERVCFIFNPSAGRGHSRQQLDQIKQRAKQIWPTVEFKLTRFEEEIRKFAEQAAGRYDLVVACGGDGTINQVVSGIAETDTPMGVLPLGSGNDFANAIGLSGDLDEAFDVLQSDHLRNTDLIRVKGDADAWCANTLGIGLDGWANYYSSTFQKLRGQAIYIFGALKAVKEFRGSSMKLTIDGEETIEDLLMVTVCNGQEEGGGFKVAPGADNSDGWIDLLIIEKLSRIRILWYLPLFMIPSRKNLKGIRYHRCKSFSFESEIPLAVHSDGELLGTEIQNLEIHLRPGLLKVKAPGTS